MPEPSARGDSAQRRSGEGAPLAAAFLLALLAIGASLGSLLAAPRGQAASGSWRGYAILLAEDSLPEAELLSALSAAGFRGVVSASTEPVLVSNWVGLETLPLDSALERLVTGDPRRDAYLESLASWFKASGGGKTYKVFYIPSFSPQVASSKLKIALEPFGGRILLPEGSARAGREAGKGGGGGAGFFLALAILGAASVAGALRDAKAPRFNFARRLAARLALGLPWALASYAGLPTAAVASLWGLAFIDAAASVDLPLAEYIRTGSFASAFDSFRRQAFPPLAILASAAIGAACEPATLPAVGLACLGSLASLAAFAVAARRLRSDEGRALFVHKPISAPKPSWTASSPWTSALALAVVGLWLAGALGLRGAASPSGTAFAYPRPSEIEGSARPGLTEARKRAEAKERGRLPDLGAWLQHRAIQEALPYERVGSPRLDPFGPVAFSRPGGEAVPLRFDEDWARAAYKSIPQASVEGMLLAQGGPVAAYSIAGASGAGKGRPLAPIEVLRYIFLLIPPLGGIAAGLRAQRGSVASETRQEA